MASTPPPAPSSSDLTPLARAVANSRAAVAKAKAATEQQRIVAVKEGLEKERLEETMGKKKAKAEEKPKKKWSMRRIQSKVAKWGARLTGKHK